MARLVIVPALPTFFARYPDIDLQLGCSERRADLIEEGIDCAVWSGELEDSTLIARRVGLLYFGTCAAPSYFAAHGQPQSSGRARGAPLHQSFLTAHRQDVRLGVRQERRTHSLDAARPRRARRREQLRGRGGGGLGHRANSGLCAQGGDGARHAWNWCWATGSPSPRRSMWCIPQNRHLSSKTRVFVDWVAELFSEHDGIQLRSTLRGRAKG